MSSSEIDPCGITQLFSSASQKISPSVLYEKEMFCLRNMIQTD